MSICVGYILGDLVFQLPPQGGVAEFQSDDGHMRDGYYGWVGYGGSVFQWHPKLKIGFAYVPTLMEFHCMHNRKGGRMQVG